MHEDYLIPFAALENIRNITSDYTRFGNDYIFARIDSSARLLDLLKEPIRLSGMTFCLLLDGHLSLEINTRRIELAPISTFALNASSTVRICDVDCHNIDAYVLFLSLEFLRDLPIDHNNIKFPPPVEGDYDPMVNNLTDNEISMLSGMMDLLYRNARMNAETMYTRNVSKSMIQALVYQYFQIAHDHTHQDHDPDRPVPRRLGYVHDFMQLVQTHYRRERSLRFYADRMFISPKYLSRIIKEATGRSAADWIDHFVVQEAKNMLRFSSKSIQQVAYALNFPSQSSFGKFFKHMTGMSPSEYQQT